MRSKPDYVKCVLTGLHEDKTTWCGRKNVVEWCFQDPAHAILNAKKEGRILICPSCADKINETLMNETWTRNEK